MSTLRGVTRDNIDEQLEAAREALLVAEGAVAVAVSRREAAGREVSRLLQEKRRMQQIAEAAS